MSIFGIFSDSEVENINNWVEKIHNELQIHILEKSTHYNFDFEQDTPKVISRKFEWDIKDTKDVKDTHKEKRSIFNRSTASALDFDEITEDIPDITRKSLD